MKPSTRLSDQSIALNLPNSESPPTSHPTPYPTIQTTSYPTIQPTRCPTEFAKQNWSNDCENAVNNQIDLEYYASHYYHLLYCFFRRDDIGLEKIANYFKKASEEEREHAEKLMDYQTLRGGRVVFKGVKEIELSLEDHIRAKSHIKEAFCLALGLEKTVNQSLLNIHRLASEKEDPQFTDFLEGEYLKEQVEANYELSKIISQLELIGNDGAGLWNFAHNFNL